MIVWSSRVVFVLNQVSLFACGVKSVPELYRRPGDEDTGNQTERSAKTALFKVYHVTQKRQSYTITPTYTNPHIFTSPFASFSLYSNMISDDGAKSLAAVLPHMTSLTDLE